MNKREKNSNDSEKKMTLFRAYVMKPAMAFYPPDEEKIQTMLPLIPTSESIEDRHVGLLFQINVNGVVERHLVVHVTHIYEPKMVGENDPHGPYRIVSTEVQL